MTYNEISKYIGSEIVLDSPEKYFNPIDDCEEYTLKFNYKVYSVNYTWINSPDDSENAYIYVTAE